MGPILGEIQGLSGKVARWTWKYNKGTIVGGGLGAGIGFAADGSDRRAGALNGFTIGSSIGGLGDAGAGIYNHLKKK